MVSHNLTVVAHLCSRIGVRQDGALVEIPSADDLRKRATRLLHTTALCAPSVELEKDQTASHPP